MGHSALTPQNQRGMKWTNTTPTILVSVILNPSPCVTLSEAKGLGFRLRVNSVKNLIISTESIIEILRRSAPQNDHLSE